MTIGRTAQEHRFMDRGEVYHGARHGFTRGERTVAEISPAFVRALGGPPKFLDVAPMKWLQ